MSVEYIPLSNARRFQVDSSCTILEYGPLGGGVSNGTVAEVDGRYPGKGWGMNVECDELVYVVSGSGAVEMPDSTQELQAGDVAFIPKGQKIAWRGEQLRVFIPCVPGWRPDQHEFFDE